jgi:hypothetical protein
MSPAWIAVLIAGVGCVTSIILQFILAGRYMERVDNLVKRQDKMDEDYKALDGKVETVLLGLGRFNDFTRRFFSQES